MSIIDSVLSRLGYSKKKGSDYPAWALENADASAPNYPTFAESTGWVEYYKKVSWVSIGVNTVAQVGSGAKWNVKRQQGEDTKDIPNHDFEKLLSHPNPTMTRKRLIYATLAYMSVTNNAYWWLNIVNGKPKEIWLIPTKQISPLPDGNLFIKGYDYDPGDGNFIRLEPWEVVHFQGFSPDSMFEGLSDLSPLRSVAGGDLGMQKWQEKLFTTGNGRLPGILAFGDAIPDDDWESIQRDVNKAAAMRNYMMLRNVKAGGVQWIQNTATQKDMEFLQQRLGNRDEIFAAIAPGLSSLLSVNASLDNARTGKSTLIDLKVYPMLQDIADMITTQILPMYGEGLICEPEDIRITDRVLRLQEIAEYSKTHTVDEVRQTYWESEPIELDEIGEMLVTPAQTYQAKEEQEEPEAIPPQLAQQQPAQQQPAEVPDGDMDDTETRAELEVVKADIYPAMLELEKWERKAKKANGKPVEFTAYNIPAEVADAVRGGLSFDDARKMLKIEPAAIVKSAEPPAEIEKLIRALELSVKAMEITTQPPAQIKSEPMQVTIHNHPGEKPDIKADFNPTINLPAPIVNVTNDVRPSDVAVQNNITAQPGEVTVTLPEAAKKSAKVSRGVDGKINGIDEI